MQIYNPIANRTAMISPLDQGLELPETNRMNNTSPFGLGLQSCSNVYRLMQLEWVFCCKTLQAKDIKDITKFTKYQFVGDLLDLWLVS